MSFHDKNDARALKYAGLMGHEFVCVAGYSTGQREVISETNGPESAKSHLTPSHIDPVLYRRVNNKWELYEIVDHL